MKEAIYETHATGTKEYVQKCEACVLRTLVAREMELIIDDSPLTVLIQMAKGLHILH